MQNKTVFVGISGGVDSAVSALLLKQQYREVIGIFMECWDNTLNNDQLGHRAFNEHKSGCSSKEDFREAQAIAQLLGIKLIKQNLVEPYWKQVFLPTIDAFKNGLTPNPDMLCNRLIKFGLMRDYCKQLDPNSDFATGHYAALSWDNNQPLLAIPKDKHKDQTYFLAHVKPAQLQDVVFPLAHLLKTEVRQIALAHHFSVATKKDSTGICFIGERHFSDFLKNYLPVKPGVIYDWKTQRQLGSHEGVWFYTTGQRSGLNLGGQAARNFVVEKDLKTNTLYVSSDPEDLQRRGITLSHFNWLYQPNPLTQTVLVRIRHAQPLVQGRITVQPNNVVQVQLDQPIDRVTNGQYGVLYTQNGICLGSGIITASQI